MAGMLWGCGPSDKPITTGGAQHTAKATVAALPAPPVMPARWANGEWLLPLGRGADDLSDQASRRLDARDLPSFGVGALEPTLSLFRIGAEPCTVTVTGYELARPTQDLARDGHYDETVVFAKASGCEPAAVSADVAADSPSGWVVAPSHLAAQPNGAQWRLVGVDVTNADNFGDDGPKPKRKQKPVPRAYRFMKHRDECSEACYVEWQVRRLPVKPAIEQVRITMNEWSDAGAYFGRVLAEEAFSMDGGKPHRRTFPTRTMVGAFVVGDQADVILFYDGASYASAAMRAGELEPEVVSFVHEPVGY